MLLMGCCIDKKTVEERGIVMEQFESMGRCNGAKIEMKRPSPKVFSENKFRDDVTAIVRNSSQETLLISSYARSALGQTGCGHFSPIAAYHEQSDQVLILDVARFKYAPYWVSLKELYVAMTCIDDATGMSRGWFLVSPSNNKRGVDEHDDKMRPGEVVNW
eukprot:CAMPEP_0172517008 /NCGR_PEP_ID=MMETSP1066-20121228/281044_1 /TAXON_ID=671091 /ORGANISM="Coscinodiscus wailesii, Strain CCMP2513" /LENGTH=160 /DNA_ID=CAMNT_0013298753 /DNA_START=258 /DNA_END=737 /DNA_ORIENTATION=-